MAANQTFDFSSRDYATIRQDLLDRATRYIPEWTDRDPSDFGVALVDLWAYVGDILHYYVDRAAQEAFITSATKRESVLGLANLFDYTPRFRSPSNGYVYLSNSSGASVNIPVGTKFSGVYNDTLYNFYTSLDYVLAAGTTTAVYASEGSITLKEIVTDGSNGQIGQRYTLNQTGIVPSSVRVYVTEGTGEEVEWLRVANVNTLPPDTAGFSVYVDTSENVEIVFGNRLSGRIPTVGATIKATYATCSGASGNVPANIVTSFTTVPPSGVSITSSTNFTAGADSESIDSIKRSLKATVRTQQRAVTLQDFVDYANLTTGVYRAAASYSASAGSASAGIVNIFAMPFVSDYPSFNNNAVTVPTATRTEIVSNIQPLALLGVTVTAASTITINKVNIVGNIVVKPSNIASAVLRDVLNAIDGLFELDQLDFGKEVRIGDVYRTIMNVSGVDYATISTFEMRTGADVLIPTGSLSPTEFLRKGSVTFTTSGGINTSL